MFNVPEKYREITGNLATTTADGNNGVFNLPIKKDYTKFFRDNLVGYIRCIASNIKGWERVAVMITSKDGSPSDRFPTQTELWRVKHQFWEPSDVIAQFFQKEGTEEKIIFLCKRIGSQYDTPHRV